MNAAYDHMREAAYLRVPPQSIEAEQSVLGGLMLAPASLSKVSDWLKPADFLRNDHRLIYTAILEMGGCTPPKPFDAVTLADWFEAQGLGEQVAGGAYLIELASTTPSAANIVAYAEIVRDKSLLRQAINSASKLQDACYQPSGRDTGEIIASHAHEITQLRGDPRGGGLVLASAGLNDWFEDLQARYAAGGKVTGMPYPWMEINDITHGLQAGELTIIAGRPSMGKSIMGLNLALFTAMRQKNTAFFSLEMTKRQVNRRSIASLCGVPHDWLLAPDSDEYWPHVTNAIRQLRGASLLVDDQAGLTVEQWVARARRAHMQRPIELLVLDHMHDMVLPGKKDPRFEIGDIAAAGKALGKEFDCPVVLLAQLNRGLEDRTDKRPVMKDLRESGAIEQKADVIWFLYRDDYYMRNEPEYKPNNVVEVILGKGRDIEVGAPVILRADFAHMAMRDWEGDKPMRKKPEAKQKQSRGFDSEF
jgi:replicative DNA helicase